jgi:hypothetical protein
MDSLGVNERYVVFRQVIGYIANDPTDLISFSQVCFLSRTVCRMFSDDMHLDVEKIPEECKRSIAIIRMLPDLVKLREIKFGYEWRKRRRIEGFCQEPRLATKIMLRLYRDMWETSKEHDEFSKNFHQRITDIVKRAGLITLEHIRPRGDLFGLISARMKFLEKNAR